MGKTFFPPVKKMEDMIERMVELAAMARKDGMMALEGQETPDKFFAKGMQLLVDGADEAKLVGQMEAELEAMKVRHGDMQGCVKAWIDLAPAMGMIGTLVGLVHMPERCTGQLSRGIWLRLIRILLVASIKN